MHTAPTVSCNSSLLLTGLQLAAASAWLLAASSRSRFRFRCRDRLCSSQRTRRGSENQVPCKANGPQSQECNRNGTLGHPPVTLESARAGAGFPSVVSRPASSASCRAPSPTTSIGGTLPSAPGPPRLFFSTCAAARTGFRTPASARQAGVRCQCGCIKHSWVCRWQGSAACWHCMQTATCLTLNSPYSAESILRGHARIALGKSTQRQITPTTGIGRGVILSHGSSVWRNTTFQ